MASIKAFFRGVSEFKVDMVTHYEGSEEIWYSRGKFFGNIITLHYYER